jgi:hypothetical protein
MAIYLVHVEELFHTCPGNPEPHAWDIRRTIIHTTPGRPCLAPVTITSGQTSRQIPCSIALPDRRQCDACRTVITYTPDSFRSRV